MIKNKLAGILLAGLLIVGGGFLIYPLYDGNIFDLVKSARNFAVEKGETIDTIRDEFVSGPLRGKSDSKDARLTRAGVIAQSNVERKAQGLKPLIENTRLNAAAEKKLQDMFDRQYFEHVSPDGKGPAYVVEQAGYRYVMVGENLALGNSKDDGALVQAWMDSPGHRANILHDRFTEIGVAVGQGTFEGKRVWMSVQEFALPASSCPSVDNALKVDLDRDRQSSDQLSAQLTKLRQKIDAAPRNTPEAEDAYRQMIDEYNDLVARYNTLVAKIKSQITEYNRQVRAFNECING